MPNKTTIHNIVPTDLQQVASDPSEFVRQFAADCEPLERENLYLLIDARTNARFCECHIKASKLIELGTIDVPLDPEGQPDYRANREIVEDHVAYEQMKEDAAVRRTFSNLVVEFTTAFDPQHSLKIIGGQHRFKAIQEALDSGIDEYHGIKVYFDLDPDQRLDVQLISNTNIDVSTDLFDRMHETLAGPQLRTWCQEVGLLEQDQDFAGKRERSKPVTVRAARTFIVNYFRGRTVNSKAFHEANTTPMMCKTGAPDPDWDQVKSDNSKLWKDTKLKEAGKEFAELIKAQRLAFTESDKTVKAKRVNVDYAEKALNFAIMAAWSFIAGVLHNNKVRLERHYALKDRTGKDPLNAPALATGRHKTDPENYRGLGYRTDAKERGRFAELLFLQSEKGDGIKAALIDLAIKKYHAKQALLEVQRAEART